MKTKPSNRPSLGVALRLVIYACEMREVQYSQVVGRSRERRVARTRFGICWALREFGLSLSRIAGVVGYNDHTSAVHAIAEAERLRASEPGFRGYTDALLTFVNDAVTSPAEAA